MKSAILRDIAGAVLLAVAALTFGCASNSAGQGHGHGMGSMMACSKCSCPMMQPDPANPSKCKMCGHDAADHNSSTNSPTAMPHQH